MALLERFFERRLRDVRPVALRRRQFTVERLEDRLVMDGDPTFVHDLPPEPPGTIVGQALITAENDYFSIIKNSSARTFNVLSNDRLVDGTTSTTLRIKEVSATKLGGQVTISEDGRRLVYTPALGKTGNDSFYYVVEDDAGNLGKANVTVDIYIPYEPTGPQSDYFTVTEDEQNYPLNVLANDLEFASGTIVGVSELASGSVVQISDDGKSILYTPAPGVKGYEHFTYTVRDADGEIGTADVRVRVLARFEAKTDQYGIDQDAPRTGLDVLANDIRRTPAEPPRIIAVSSPSAGGTVAIADDGQSILYHPAAGFIGHDSFTYTVRYGPEAHHSSTGSVKIKVEDPYFAVDNWFTVLPGSSANTLDVLANDPILAPSNLSTAARSLQITGVRTGSHGGQITVSEDGQRVLYTPAAGFVGDETFAYRVVDNAGHTDSAVVTVHVAEPAADPFNLPRFVHPAELEQFLLDEAVERFKNLFGKRGYHYVPGTFDDSIVFYETVATTSNGVDRSYSTTNTQEAGIDEADIVETDGDYVYSFSNGKLVIIDVRDLANPELVSLTEFDGTVDGMYLLGDRLAIIGSKGWNETVVVLLDVSDRTDPQLLQRTEISGQIVDSRVVDGRLQLVTKHSVELPAPEVIVDETDDNPDGYNGSYESIDQYIARVQGHLAVLSLPTYRTYGPDGELLASGLLNEAGDIHKPVSDADRKLISITTFDLTGDSGPVSSTGLFAGGATQTYVSESAVYVIRLDRWVDEGSTRTQYAEILKFSFGDDGQTSLEAAGRVRGSVLNQFSLDEHDGFLRVATTETIYSTVSKRALRTENHLFVLAHDGTDLSIVGSVEHLAPTETIRSVRFMGDRAYVVTFRQVDPLFAIDLSDPTAPVVEGQLKVPGFSNYLHPVGEDFVIGFGQDANEITGALLAPQVSLFYVGDMANPVMVDRMFLTGVDHAWSEAYFDHHAFAYFPEHQVLSIPIDWRASLVESTSLVENTTLGHEHEAKSAAWIFQIDIDGNTGSLDFAGRIEHDAKVRRSVRIGDALVTVSNNSLKINDIDDPSIAIGEVYLGRLLRDDQFNVVEDSQDVALDVRANDRPGTGGQAPLIVEVTQPMTGGSYLWYGTPSEPAGTVEISPDGQSLIFTPAENFFGTATFTYTVFDAVRGNETASVTIVIENVPDDPDAVDDEFEVAAGSGTTVLEVLGNDVNVDHQSPHWSPYVDGLILKLAVRPMAAPATDMAIVTADFASNTLLGDAYFIGSPISLNNGLQITAVGPTDHGGTVEISFDGLRLDYTPADGFEGIETFTYTVTTEFGRTDTATVTVRVGEVPEPIMASIAEFPEERQATEQPATRSSARPMLAAFQQDARPNREIFSRRDRAAIGSAREKVFSADGWNRWELLLTEIGESRRERPADRAFAELKLDDDVEEADSDAAELERDALPRVFEVCLRN